MASASPDKKAPARAHQDHIADAGFVSDHWFALIHTPIPIKEALRNPVAKKALAREWEKLDSMKAFRKGTVRPRTEVEKKRSKGLYQRDPN